LSEAAQGELPKHEVFEKPFKVKPVYEWWETPSNYRDYPGGEKLPDKLKVWRVQKTTDKPGEVPNPYGAVSRPFENSEEAEALVVGYNTFKGNGAVAVGRHGNFLQWGFPAPPSKMTDAGRMFFLNCVCYIKKFDGKAPLTRSKPTEWPVRRGAAQE
jgi:hypothetical protein